MPQTGYKNAFYLCNEQVQPQHTRHAGVGVITTEHAQALSTATACRLCRVLPKNATHSGFPAPIASCSPPASTAVHPPPQ